MVNEGMSVSFQKKRDICTTSIWKENFFTLKYGFSEPEVQYAQAAAGVWVASVSVGLPWALGRALQSLSPV